MKERIIELIILLGIFVLVALSVSGCATLRGFQQDIGMECKDEVVITEPPTPGVQLWNAAKQTNWLVTAGILVIAGGIFAVMNGSIKLGAASIVSGCVSMFLALAVARFALWMAVCGLIGTIAVVGFSILARRKALVEIIMGVQKFKDLHSVPVLGARLREQSPTTKRIVSNIKNDLKLKGKI